jgi:phosphoesterase RecJ-like protein
MNQWTTTTTPAEIAEWIDQTETIALLTHAKPDGDALGSTLALCRAINLKKGTSGATSSAECWYAGPMPSWASKLTANTKVRHEETGSMNPGVFDPQGVLITDTGSWSQLDPYRAFLEPRLDRTVIVDHHLQGNGEIASKRLITTDAAAVVQPVADICVALLGLESAAQLPVEIALPLYVGLATDTGWFKHSSVTPEVMRLAGDLLETGVDHSALFAMLYQRDRASRLKLMAKALASLEVIHEKNLAVMMLTDQDFKDCGAAPGDSGGFVDLPQSVASIRVVALMTEHHDADGVLTKISMRSKPSEWEGKDPIDVNAVCNTLGGGGHARASGARVREDLATTKRMIIEALG